MKVSELFENKVEEARNGHLQRVHVPVLYDPKDKQSLLKNLLDKMSDNASKNLGIDAGVDDFRALFVGGDSKGKNRLLQALVDAGYDASGEWKANRKFFQKIGVNLGDYNSLDFHKQVYDRRGPDELDSFARSTVRRPDLLSRSK